MAKTRCFTSLRPPIVVCLLNTPGKAIACFGFTLIEAMVVVAIVAILAAVAAPAFQEMIRNSRLSAASSALQASLNLARSEASKRGSDARVTVAANGTAGAWSNGWTVFEDRTANANGAVAPTADDATVRRIEVISALPATVSFSQTSSLNYFIYNGQGRMISETGASAARSFWFFDSTSERYCIVVNFTGRVRTERVPSGTNCATD